MSSNWWAKKLAPQNLTQNEVPKVAPQPATYAKPIQPSYPPSQQLTPEAGRCPGCGSGNYGGATPESRKRCYDCGYPIVQSGTGVGSGIVGQGGEATGPATPARQIQTGGWNPTTIIGKLE